MERRYPDHLVIKQGEQLRTLYREPREVSSLANPTPGINVIMPVYDPKRTDVRELALLSIARQLPQTPGIPAEYRAPEGTAFTNGPVNVIIADNGMPPEGIQRIQEVGKRLGLNIHIAPAHPHEGRPHEKSAAYARSQAVKYIREHRFDEGSLLNVNTLGLLDDDMVYVPGSLKSMHNTYSTTPGVVAVTADVSGVFELTPEIYDQRSQQQQPQHARARRLPPIVTSRGYDLGGVVAYSSQMTGKFGGSLFSATVAIDGMDEFSPSFYSFEDNFTLGRLSMSGDTIFDPNAVVLDRARQTEEEMHQQQLQWGIDQDYAIMHLSNIGMVEPGIHVFVPNYGSGWEELVIPAPEGVTSIIVNPDELKEMAAALRADLKAGNPLLKDSSETLEEGLRIFQQIINFVDFHREHKNFTTIERDEFPIPVKRSASDPRSLTVAMKARFAGNLIGMREINGPWTGAIPKWSLLGHRQSNGIYRTQAEDAS